MAQRYFSAAGKVVHTLNDVYTLTVSVTSATWASLSSGGDIPSARSDHTMTALGDGTAVLFGGRDGAYLSDVYTLTVSGDQCLLGVAG